MALIMLFINWRLSLAFSLFGSFIIFVLLPPLKLLINALTDQTKFPIFIKSIKKSTLIITFIGTLWLIITNIVIISPELSLEIKLFLFTVGYFFSGLTFYFFTPKFFLWLFRRYGLNIYKEEK
ncbi:hypothetical protein HYX16_05460 [Candidatus Woesearchaeota archaeon]|nr:hypothetical protein [Candidatus Woesearchaeota archaeon]